MKPIVVLVLLVHACIHLIGTAKAFQWIEVSQLSQSISKMSGIVWFLVCCAFLVTLVLYLFEQPYWWVLGLTAVVMSQWLMFQHWSDTKWGTVANMFLLLPIAIAVAQSLPSGFLGIYTREAKEGVGRFRRSTLLLESEMQHLPRPVQRYIQYSGALGKPQVQNFKVVFEGYMRNKIDAGWMQIKAQQYSFWDHPTRIFYINSSLMGIPYDGLHLYKGRNATMRVRIASMFQIVNAKGDKMNRGETVTMFNDMCIMAPGLLVDKNIEWFPIDSLSAEAKFTNAGNTISATLYFNPRGELVNFVSHDRYLSEDGIVYKNYAWSTPISEYREFDGRRVASKGEAIWETPEGEFSYAKFITKELVYNCEDFK